MPGKDGDSRTDSPGTPASPRQRQGPRPSANLFAGPGDCAQGAAGVDEQQPSVASMESRSSAAMRTRTTGRLSDRSPLVGTADFVGDIREPCFASERGSTVIEQNYSRLGCSRKGGAAAVPHPGAPPPQSPPRHGQQSRPADLALARHPGSTAVIAEIRPEAEPHLHRRLLSLAVRSVNTGRIPEAAVGNAMNGHGFRTMKNHWAGLFSGYAAAKEQSRERSPDSMLAQNRER